MMIDFVEIGQKLEDYGLFEAACHKHELMKSDAEL